MNPLTPAQLEDLIARLPGLRVGVIGDFALDVYWTLNPEAALPSVETGRPTRPVSEQRYAAGAAGNVAANFAALGCGGVAAWGVVGRDPWGAELLRILRGLGVETAGLIEQDRDWATVAYAKPHVGGVEQDRVDFGDFNRLHDETAGRLLAALESALPGLDAVVINAQARAGIHSAEFRRRLADLIRARPDLLFAVDSRSPEALYAGCVLKMNDREAARECGRAPAPGSDVSREQARAAALELHGRQGRPVFVTRGAAGMVVCDASGAAEIPAVLLEGEVDTVGAGDAAMAGIVAGLAGGLAPVAAAGVGNLAAAVCAGKLRQTGTASPGELLALAKQEAGRFSRGRDARAIRAIGPDAPAESSAG